MKAFFSLLLPAFFASNQILDSCLFHQLSCINGCANENADRVIICAKSDNSRCIKKKGSSRTIETTTNPSEYNRFSFDYTGNDRFKLFSDNSRDYIALHVTNTWQWRTGNFEPEVFDTQDGTLDIFTIACESAGNVPYCNPRSMCPYGNGVHTTWGHQECWIGKKV